MSSVAFGQEKPDKVTIGIQLVTAEDIIAKQEGWAEELLGVPIEWVTFDSGRDAILALASGVDMTLVGSAPTAFGLSAGVPGEVAWIFHLLGANETLVGREGVSSVEDLAGKKVAVPFGSTTHYDMLQALDLAGLTPEDLTLLDMDPNTMVAAFERGDIDAAWVWFPALEGLYNAGGQPIMDAHDLAEAGFPTSDLLVVNPAFGKKYPDIVARYVATLNRAATLARESPDAAAQAVADEFGIDLETAKTALAQVERLSAKEQLSAIYLGNSEAKGDFANSLWSQAQFLKEQGIIEEAFDLEYYREHVNPGYLEQATESGYLN